jgi:hypothetical protein
MTLKYPNTNVEFVVSPAYFIAEFDVYDREEDLGESLNEFDPNDKEDLERLFAERLLSGGNEAYTPAHKGELLRVLGDALANPAYNFERLLSQTDNENEYFTLPSSWVIRIPRNFFATAYRVIYRAWGEDARNAGCVIRDPNDLDAE